MMKENEKYHGPIPIMKEQAITKKLLVIAYTGDIERYQKLLSQTMMELAEYEDVLKRLDGGE